MSTAITNKAFWDARLAAAQAALIAAEDAQLSIMTDKMTSYTMNTGQGVVTVQKSNINVLNDLIDALTNRILNIERRLCGTNIIIGRASW